MIPLVFDLSRDEYVKLTYVLLCLLVFTCQSRRSILDPIDTGPKQTSQLDKSVYPAVR